MSDSPLTLFDLAPGKVLADRYLIKKPNRHGGMAATFIVTDSSEGTERELHVFPSALFDKKAQADDFAVLLDRWLEIDSKAIARVRKVIVRDDGTLLMVTDVPQGGSLRDWLNENKRMPIAEVVELGKHLLAGLIQVHAVGLVHGDIKPHAIHINGGPRDTILVDGGITSGLWSAMHLGDKTALIGTPFYAPVEQFGGESPDIQSDVYNIATVLYELCTGVVPWPGSSFLEIFQAKLAKQPPSMRSRAGDVQVPEALETAIVGGLLADRSERYYSVQAFLEKLEAVELG
ncbi:MAG: serine/threonine protein kinase [Planctomycetota bacterium]|jgi:serine/threonine protein kinase